LLAQNQLLPMVDGFVMMLEDCLRSLPRTTRGTEFDDYGQLRWLMRLEPALQGAFMRLCHLLPVALKAWSTSPSKQIVVAVL